MSYREVSKYCCETAWIDFLFFPIRQRPPADEGALLEMNFPLRDGIARADRMPSKSSSERSNLIALECPIKSTMGKPYRPNLK